MKCAARAAPVSAVFTLGDNFYGDGVASADDPQFEFKWASVYADAALDVPWYPALGDHDHVRRRGRAGAVLRAARAVADAGGVLRRDVRVRKRRARSSSSWTGCGWRGRFRGARRTGGSASVCARTRRATTTSEEHWEWLRQDAREGRSDVARRRRPQAESISVSARSARDDAAFPAEKKTRNALREAMETFGVDLWINGHDHTVQVACSETPKGATHFVTAGVGGYDLHELSPSAEWPEETAFADASFHGFAAHRFTADAITTHFLDARADVRHSFVIGKRSKTCPGREGIY
jgi:hypothetical protein